MLGIAWGQMSAMEGVGVPTRILPVGGSEPWRGHGYIGVCSLSNRVEKCVIVLKERKDQPQYTLP